MSILGKKWLIKNSDSSLSTFDKLLLNRGISDKAAQDLFLNIEEQQFHCPFLFSQMNKAVERIGTAIKNNERIMIFGDYDVDGITSTAILISILKRLTPSVSYRIPHRIEDGYGLSTKFIEEFREKNIGLIITVDNGISCKDQIDLANSYGIDTIITDHHTIPENCPAAYAIIHPKHPESGYPYDELTGAGVAFKLAHALLDSFFDPEEKEKLLTHLVELATLGTIADLGPLNGENRLIVKKGLSQLSKTNWPGLQKIMDNAGITASSLVDSTTVGFKIAPRINAAGRIGNPYIPLQLILNHTHSEKIHELGKMLEELNNSRKNMTEKILREVHNSIDPLNIPNVIVFSNPDWHIGILGLVAGKIAEEFHRPVILFQQTDETLVGSARSPDFFNIISAITEIKDLLINFGGHAQAAGMTMELKNLEKFTENINQKAAKTIAEQPFFSTINIDCELGPEEVSLNFLDTLESMQPFGVGNEQPVFLLKNLSPLFIKTVGKDQNHLSFTIEINDRIKAIGFGLGGYAEVLKNAPKIDLVCRMERNFFNNSIYLNLHVLDFAV